VLAQVIFELFWMKYTVAVGIFLSCQFNTNMVLMMRMMVMSVKSVFMEIMMERLMTAGRYVTILSVTSLRNHTP
jgi:hypothetical protein